MFLKIFLFVIGINLGCSLLLEDTELLLTYVVFRHGERTPEAPQMVFSDDLPTLTELTQPWGYGTLTDKGKRRSVIIGEILRKRYDDLLSIRYNSTELYFRSTDVDRTKMTGLTAMVGLYPTVPSTRWSYAIDWNPVPYTTLPAELDFMQSYRSCPRYSTFFLQTLSGIAREIPALQQYQKLFELLSNNTGYDFVTRPTLLYNLYDVYQSELGLGMTLQDWVQEVYDEIAEATNIIARLIFTQEEALKLNGGRLLNDFLEVSRSIINGDSVNQRVRLYSAHDVNVSGQMAAARVFNNYQTYGSTFAMELRRDLKTDQYYVLPVHVRSPGESDIEYLKVEGCSDVFCDFDEFFSLTSGYAVNQTQYDYLCNNGDAIAL